MWVHAIFMSGGLMCLKWSVTKRNTARLANLCVLVYTTTQRGTVPSCTYRVQCRKRTAWLLNACGDKMPAGVDSVQAQD